ncbi:MAG TPA: aminoacetone oxidase family FAD-binding enzyme, partial [Verrucomicrobiae bacterium]|nr:aminoacetone oxidase family FAD-binding enzyme [Verrucomicrobiae bacterium]
MNSERIVIVGGGAAGFFAALACAESRRDAEIFILEKTSQFLSKVKISGGGRCNVTHADFDPREFSKRFPRGERALISAFGKFQAGDTVNWFESRGVKLKIESDGRMFPTTDSSQTIVDCLLNAAQKAGVKLKTNCSVEKVSKKSGGGFELKLSNDEILVCNKLLLATGGCRTLALGQLAVSLGHTLEPPVPSLFTFHIAMPWLHELAGVSVESVEASVPETKLRERGALLVTHWGLSGPAILRLSAWGARELHEKNYQFKLQINWLPNFNEEKLAAEFQARKKSQPAKFIVNLPLAKIPARLWERLV